MSLKAIDMDPFLLAGIYRQPLIQMNTESPDTPSGQFQPLPSLGNNSQKILLLIHNEKEAYLSEPVFNLLTNLLKACKLTLDDVALVNTARLPEADLYLLSQHFSPHKAILFGDAFPALSARKTKNNPWEEAGCRFLLTDSLEALNEDKQLKVPFWNALRLFFNLTV